MAPRREEPVRQLLFFLQVAENGHCAERADVSSDSKHPPRGSSGEPFMFRRREPVPFAFIAEAERFRSNVTLPPRRHASRTQIAGGTLLGLTVVSGLVGALLLGVPALESGTPAAGQTSQSQAGSTSQR
jgi:hypothetical protein